jgi:tetratricopeptide (TPR) repeat protein
MLRMIAGLLVVAGVVVAILVGVKLSTPDLAALERRAAAASIDKQWSKAATLWSRFNQAGSASGESLLSEARAQLGLERARDAESAIRRATEVEPSLSDPWRLWLEILRMEDRPVEAIEVGERALASVGPADRRDVLKALTLALFADPPDEVALPTLRAWAQADPDDLHARLAVLARQVQTGPRQSGPIAARSARVSTLEAMFERHPEHAGVRAAMVGALGESGEIERGRVLIATWPESARDLTYERMRGRWALDYDNKPEEAEAAYRRVLSVLPYDWKTRTRLARALHAQGRIKDAALEAEMVARHREALDPQHLGPRLANDLERIDEAASLLDLAALCEAVSLEEVGKAWRTEAERALQAKGRDPN